MLRSNHSGLISFVVPDLSPTYYSMLSVELAREATSAGMQLVVQQSQHSASEENSIIGSALSSLADGFFVAPVAHYADEDLSMLIGDKPAVILGDFTQTTRYDRVKSPNSEGVNSAIQHLRQQGCTSIGIVGGMTDDKEADIPEGSSVLTLQGLRMHAAMDALADLYHENRESIVNERLIDVGWNSDEGIRAANLFMEAGMPYDGLFCLDDEIALGMLHGLHEAGVRVPEQVKIIGFNGIRHSAISTPTLSTVEVDLPGMASAVVSLLRRRIEHPDVETLPQKVTVGTILRARESTAAGNV